jgi:hypothetical protein
MPATASAGEQARTDTASRAAHLSGSFTLLEFAPDVTVSVAFQEYAAGGQLVDEKDVVQFLTELYDELRGQALGPDESLALIAELMAQQE